MRSYLFAASALAALTLVSITPGPADAFFFCKKGGYNSRPMYYAPQPYLMPVPVATVTVVAKDGSFDKATITVESGTTVRWVNEGLKPHTVSSNDGKFESGDLAHGATFTATFVTPGTYKYHCHHHKGMEGTVIVEKKKDAN